MNEIKEIKNKASEKLVAIREKRNEEIKAVKEKAKKQAEESADLKPVKIGEIDLDGIDLTDVFSIAVARKDGDGFKKGDVVMRKSKPAFMPLAQSEIDRIKDEAEKEISLVKAERDEEISKAEVDLNKEKAEAYEAKIKAEEAKLAEKKARLAKLKGL